VLLLLMLLLLLLLQITGSREASRYNGGRGCCWCRC